MNKHFKCLTTGKTWPLSPKIVGCPQHPGPYSDLIVEDTSFDIDAINSTTPLCNLTTLAKKYGFKNLYLKDESKNLTGSFKDRGAEEVMEHLIKWRIKECFVVSCGNDAISTAAYAQKAGIDCVCIVPKGVNGAKGKLIQLYGGKLAVFNGSYETAFKSMTTVTKGYNTSGGYNPIKEEGMKKISYELGEFPEIVVIPCGNGTLLWSIYKGFKELQNVNYIKKLPKLIAVQVRGGDPLNKGVIKDPIDSIADGIVASESFSAKKVTLALKDTKGEIITVTDKEIIQGLKDAIELESIIPEPTSASVFAVVKKLKQKDKKIVLILTAGGYKNLDQISELLNPIQK